MLFVARKELSCALYELAFHSKVIVRVLSITNNTIKDKNVINIILSTNVTTKSDTFAKE